MTGMQDSMNTAAVRRRHARADAALGPRAGGAPDPALPRHALDLHPDDGDRPASAAPTSASYDLSSLRQHQRRRRGDAAGRGAAAAGRVRPDLRRRLRPHRDHRAHPHQSARARQAAMPGHPDLTASTRAWSIPATLQELPPGEVGRDHRHAARRCARATGASGAPREEPSSSIDGKRFFRTGDLGRDGRGRLLLHDRPAEAHDQCERLQGLAGRGGDAAVQASGDPGGLHHRRAGRVPRRDGQGGGGARRERGKVSEQDIIDWAHGNMAAYKGPRIVEFVDALPKSGSGKVMWRELQEQAMAGPGRELNQQDERRQACDLTTR